MFAGRWLQELLPWDGLQAMRILRTYPPSFYERQSRTIYLEIGAFRRSLSNYVCDTTIIWVDQVNIVLSHVTMDSRMEPCLCRKAWTDRFRVWNKHVRGRRKEYPIKGLVVLEQKQVTLSITFYRYIFLVYHLVFLILIVSYDALDINLPWESKLLHRTANATVSDVSASLQTHLIWKLVLLEGRCRIMFVIQPSFEWTKLI